MTTNWLPSITVHTLDSYITFVNKVPLLSLEEEIECVAKYKESGDKEAFQKLILSHLRLVVSIARQNKGYNLPLEDLISEGTIGLLRGAPKYEIGHDSRFSTYVMHWIKSEIQEYVLKNFKSIKIATSKEQRKLFFNLKGIKKVFDQNAEVPRRFMTTNQVSTVAEMLNVTVKQVKEMEIRLTAPEIQLDPLRSEDDDNSTPEQFLFSDDYEPTKILAKLDKENLIEHLIPDLLKTMDERTQDIVKARWVDVDDEGRGSTLTDLAKKYNVSAERIRQLEAKAFKKIQESLEEFV